MKRLINHWCELSTQNMKNIINCSCARYSDISTITHSSSKKSTKISRYHFFSISHTPSVNPICLPVVGSSVYFNLVSVLHVESLSLLILWLLTLYEAAAGLLIQALRSMWIGPTACLLGRDLQALFMLEFSTAPDSDPSPCLVSSEQSCQAHFIFPCSSHWSRAVFSEVMGISFVVQK